MAEWPTSRADRPRQLLAEWAGASTGARGYLRLQGSRHAGGADVDSGHHRCARPPAWTPAAPTGAGVPHTRTTPAGAPARHRRSSAAGVAGVRPRDAGGARHLSSTCDRRDTGGRGVPHRTAARVHRSRGPGGRPPNPARAQASTRAARPPRGGWRTVADARKPTRCEPARRHPALGRWERRRPRRPARVRGGHRAGTGHPATSVEPPRPALPRAGAVAQRERRARSLSASFGVGCATGATTNICGIAGPWAPLGGRHLILNAMIA